MIMRITTIAIILLFLGLLKLITGLTSFNNKSCYQTQNNASNKIIHKFGKENNNANITIFCHICRLADV